MEIFTVLRPTLPIALIGFCLVPWNAAAQTPTVPTIWVGTGNPVGLPGVAVDQVPAGRGEQVEVVSHQSVGTSSVDLTWEIVRGGTSAISTLLSNLTNEPVPADLNNGWALYAEFSFNPNWPNGGPSEMLVTDLFGPAAYNLSGETPEMEWRPAVHDFRAAWEAGGEVFTYDLSPLALGVPGAPVQLGTGTHPAVRYDTVAFETPAGDLTVHDAAANVSTLITVGGATKPSLGGNLVAYEIVGTGTIEYRNLATPGTAVTINGPCGAHSTPKLNESGSLVIYHGTAGCPAADGAVPLYVTVLDAVPQQTYLIGDLLEVSTYDLASSPYDIDEDVIAYHQWGPTSTALYYLKLDL